MNGFVYRNQLTFSLISGVIIYCLVVFPVTGSAAWGAPAEKAALSVKEKEALVQQGVEKYNQGDIETAQQNLERARTEFPENHAAPYYLGLIYLKQGKRAAAIAQWRQYVEMDPRSENALRIRKNLTVLLREEAQASARTAMANEASLVGRPADKNTVAISNFKNLGSENIKPLGKGMAALLIHDLSLVPGLAVVERVQLQAMLEEMKMGTTGLITAESAPKIGKLLKAKHITSGSLADLEKENLQIASAVVDADQVSAVSTQQAKGELKKFYELEKEIACQIVEDLGKNCKDVPPAFNNIHTKSLAAFSFFAVGLDHLDRQQYSKARESFQNSIAEDPSFEMAQKALLATPVPSMQYMSATGSETAAGGAGSAGGLGTTEEMIAMASAHGADASVAGSALAAAGGSTTAAAATGVGIAPVLGIVGGAAVVGGVAVAASDSSSSDGGTTTGTQQTAQCDETQREGRDLPEERPIEMGKSSGTFNFTYNMQTIRDQMIVKYEGRVLHDTECARGFNSLSLSYSGSATQIRVQVIPNCDGNTVNTRWSYIVGCP